MDLDSLDVQYVPVVGLLAAIPAAVYLIARGDLVVALTFLNIVLIAAGLYYMFGPSEAEAAGEGHGHRGPA
jgi:hypothetical protein